ncbi:hypothetical protein OK074_3584 [Actinobacteria bacterium OK074]|nr:hypothetical protein OK074_3584 [Actinobacteria bacterium OK074]
MTPPPAPRGTDAEDRPGLCAAPGAGSGAAPGRRFRFELAAHPASVARARQVTRDRLAHWQVCPDTRDSAELVVSELVTNAIVHTASEHVVCELHDSEETELVRIAVHDEGCASGATPGDGHPARRRSAEERGRGLLLVDALCRAWGAHEAGPGLLVWAELHRGEGERERGGGPVPAAPERAADPLGPTARAGDLSRSGDRSYDGQHDRSPLENTGRAWSADPGWGTKKPPVVKPSAVRDRGTTRALTGIEALRGTGAEWV